MKTSSKLPCALARFIAAVCLVALAACSESMARRDAINPSLGNAIAANTALQTIDPWPRYVEKTHIHTDGAKASNAIDAYRAPPEDGKSETGILTVVSPTTQPGAAP